MCGVYSYTKLYRQWYLLDKRYGFHRWSYTGCYGCHTLVVMYLALQQQTHTFLAVLAVVNLLAGGCLNYLYPRWFQAVTLWGGSIVSPFKPETLDSCIVRSEETIPRVAAPV